MCNPANKPTNQRRNIRKPSLPGGTVAVVQRRGLLVLDAVPGLLGQDLVPALVEILVDGTGQLRLCSA